MIIDKKEYNELIDAKNKLYSLKLENDRLNSDIKSLKDELKDAKESYFELKKSGFKLEVISERASAYSKGEFAIRKTSVWISSDDLGQNLRSRLSAIIKSVANRNIDQENLDINKKINIELSTYKDILLHTVDRCKLPLMGKKHYFKTIIEDKFKRIEL